MGINLKNKLFNSWCNILFSRDQIEMSYMKCNQIILIVFCLLVINFWWSKISQTKEKRGWSNQFIYFLYIYACIQSIGTETRLNDDNKSAILRKCYFCITCMLYWKRNSFITCMDDDTPGRIMCVSLPKWKHLWNSSMLDTNEMKEAHCICLEG